MLEGTRSDVSTWQEEILNQVKAAENKIEENITEIQSEFERQKNDLIVSTDEERAQLRKDLSRIGDDVVRLEADLKTRSAEALSEFRKEYGSFMEDLQAKTRELQGEADRKLKELKSSSQEAFDHMDATQKRLASKIEESYTSLSKNMAEIEKRQKDFVAQTKIFNRADSLKVALTEDIEELKNQIRTVKGEAKGLKEVEKNFQKVKKLGNEVSVKLTRFLAEKRRIEIMESDFKKLLTISQSVDSKLDEVTGSHDELTAVQAEIRKLETLEKDVFAKYERLEGKNKILDSTTEGVDKNFQAMEILEHQLDTLEKGVTAIPKRLDDLSGRIEILARSKKDADSAVEQLSALGSLLGDIEERTEKMQQAREWLARTETRLEEISKQAEQQVKLLGSLLKDEAKQGRKDKGAPSLSTRDMVTRLAHQGWKIPQIAQATKLSRGEVELILELLPKSK
jgi:chromosome segregation ATPase